MPTPTDWTLVYDICRRDRADGGEIQPVMLVPPHIGGVATLAEAWELVKALQAADAAIGAALRTYVIFPLVKHKDFGVYPDDDGATLSLLCGDTDESEDTGSGKTN